VMKKLIIGLVAIGVVLAVRPFMKRKAQRMREHCEQMAAKCKEKMVQSGASEEAGIPGHCKEMAAQHKEKMAQFHAGQEASVSEPEPTVVASGDRSEALSTS
jgi:hypothetical protein